VLPDSFVILLQGMNLIGTAEAGKRLGISQDRVRTLIKEGRLPATKLGRDYFMDPKDLALVKNRKPGRPSKQRK
jgi:excisionase family DNA binding protein